MVGVMSKTHLSKNYATIFRDYVINSIQNTLAKIPPGEILSPEERDQALHVLSYALKRPGVWSDTRDLLLALAPKMEQAGMRDEWIPYLEQGLEHSQAHGDDEATAELHYHLGILYESRGEYEQAHSQFEASASYFADLGLSLSQAQALNRLAYVTRRRRHYEKATQIVNRALELLSEEETERAYSYLVLGTIALDEQDWPKAVNFFQQSRDLWEKTNNQRMLAWCLTNLGAAWRRLGKYQEAIQVYERAIKLLGQIQDPINQAVAQMNLGNIHLDLQEPGRALELYASAEKTFRRAQDRLRLAKIYNNIGLAYHWLKAWEKAETSFIASIEQYEKIGNIPSLVNAVDGLGLVYLDAGNFMKAKTMFEGALRDLAQVKDDPRYDELFDALMGHLENVSAQSNLPVPEE